MGKINRTAILSGILIGIGVIINTPELFTEQYLN